MHRAFALAFTLALAASALVRAQPPGETRTVLAGVSLRGDSQISSVEAPREPRFVVRNTSTETRTVTLVELTSLGSGSRRTLTILGPQTITLAPGVSQAFRVRFRGQALQSSVGLTYHRFRLTVRVGTETGDAISSVGYMCRIPVHR